MNISTNTFPVAVRPANVNAPTVIPVANQPRAEYLPNRKARRRRAALRRAR